jgi:hypothetical protein
MLPLQSGFCRHRPGHHVTRKQYKQFAQGALPFLTLAGLLLGSSPLLAAESASFTLQGSDGDKTIVIPKLTEEASIDGKLDEAAWKQALLLEDFHQYEPVEYAEPSQKSQVWIYYTENALYISHFFEEPDMSLVSANIMRQGQGLASDDILAVVLDPYLDRRNGYRFEVNANGVRWEGLFQNVTDIEGNWDGIWQADAVRVENGWYGEMKIPFQTIAFNPDSDSWGINFRRAIRRNNESIAWVSRNRQVNPGVAGTMTGLNGMKQGIGLDIVPSMTLRSDRVYGPASFSEQNYEPQLDVYYKLTPQLNASLTINTDFSAAEVDSRQVNLTRFNLFFPEQRDFFIRESDIFEFGLIGTGGFSSGSGNPAIPNAAAQNARPFFSRRIGLSSRGTPVGIDVGGKVSGRIGDWNVGTLMIRQDEDSPSGVDSQDIFVGRAVLNVLAESQLGVITTYGDPQSNLDNSMAGVDFRYRNSKLPGGQTLQGVTFYQQSNREDLEDDDASYGFGLFYPASQGLRGGYNYKRIEKNFDPAVGFVNQTDVEDHALDFGYRHFFRPGGYFRSVYGGFDGYRANNLDDGSVNNQNLGLRVTGQNNAGDGMFVRVIRSREVLRTPFTINRSSDGLSRTIIPAGDYGFTEGLVGVDLASQRKVSGRISTRWGSYYDGNRVQRGFELNYRPTARYMFGGQYTENEIHLPQGNFTVRLISLQTQVSFMSTLSWSTLFQYDNVSEVLGFNSRLHWIPEAGREAFLVFNYGVNDLDKDNDFTSTNADLSLKFNYTFRF